jgi:ketosteroid isomerase-like protein
VQEAFTAFGRGDLETTISCFAEDIAVQHPMTKEKYDLSAGGFSAKRHYVNVTEEQNTAE